MASIPACPDRLKQGETSRQAQVARTLPVCLSYPSIGRGQEQAGLEKVKTTSPAQTGRQVRTTLGGA